MSTNYSSYGSVLTLPTAPGEPATEGYKWNPGAYAFFVPGSYQGHLHGRIDIPQIRQQIIDFINNELAGSGFKGIMFKANLRAIDHRVTSPPTSTTLDMADYQLGFDALDEIMAALVAHGLRMVVSMTIDTSGGSINPQDTVPEYFVTDMATYGWTQKYNVHTQSYTLGLTARLWQQATANRIIAAEQALAAHFDDHPKFEAISFFGETAMSVNGDDGYTDAGVKAQWTRVMADAYDSWPHTQRYQWFNDVAPWTDANAADYMNLCLQYKITYTNPNTTKAGPGTQTDRMFCGINDQGVGPPTSGFTDHRGSICVFASTDSNDYFAGSPYETNPTGTPYQTLDEIWTMQTVGWDYGLINQPSLEPSHYCWYVNDWAGDNTNQWPAEKAFLQAKIAAGLPYPDVPTMFPSVVTGG